MSHHVESFRAALTVLASHGHIKQRLIQAFERHLQDVDDEGLPVMVRERFADLRQKMAEVAPLNGEGSICASVRKMSIAQANGCSRSVVDMYGEIVRTAGDEEESLPPPTGDEVDVPPMLLKTV